MAKQTSFTYKLTPAQETALTRVLREGNYRPLAMEHTKIASETEKCKIALYKSGKCLVQGREAEDFVTFVLEPLVLKQAQVGYEDVLDPKASQPHMGVDESGKGDFFGPMVIAAAYVDADLVKAMREMGVKDSKSISSDDKAMNMGRDLRNMLGRRCAVVKVGPAAYNRLYSRMRNVNTMLGWAHARSIENLLEHVPDCSRAISDQFGNKQQVAKALMQKGRRIELEQRHRAESDMAVAAASVIAREAFLRSLKEMSDRYEVVVPKGASAAVRTAAVQLATQHGPGILLETAKCHFQTTDKVLAQLGLNREALGPEGQAVSRATGFRRRPAS